MRVLVDARDKLGVPWQNLENEKHGMFVMSFENKAGIPVEPCTFQLYVPALQALWGDSGIQEAYGRRSEFQLVSNFHLRESDGCYWASEYRQCTCIYRGVSHIHA